CGACLDACPVKVDIPRMLLRMRALAAEKKEGPWVERAIFRTGGFLLRHPWVYRAAGWTASKLQRPLVRDGAVVMLPWPFSRWTRKRAFPPVAARSFQSRWKTLRWEAPPAPPAPPERPADAAGALAASGDGGPPGVIRRAGRALRTGAPHAGGVRIAPIEPPQGSPAERFRRELEAVNGRVYRAGELGDASRIVRALLTDKGISSVAAWDTPRLRILEGAISAEGPKAAWLWGAGRERDFERLKTAEMGITEADFALAASGTLGLIARPGRSRLVSLLPAVHVALLAERQLVEGLEDLPEILRDAFAPPPGEAGAVQAVDLITGPSRSSDIGMVPTLGAHGPKEVHVILLEGELEAEEAGELAEVAEWMGTA
ncbi:MAG: LUD domain-containing protein, partial [Nitrospinota bacterium]